MPPRRHARQLNLQRIRQESRAELRQKKYRYLYQVRTAHGDVISQVSEFNSYVIFIKAIRRDLTKIILWVENYNIRNRLI